MRIALGLAARGLGRTAPNPAVGCVLVRDGRIVGRGWTRPGGRPHAETEALARAGAAARGATAYVTLEPCAHHGRTPPCAEALVAAGIARAVAAHGDPDPRVSGRGVAILRRAGIPVLMPCLEAEAAAINRGFLTRLARGRPMVTLKLALSLDGRIATATGESRWITGPAARREVHLARARADAVLVGAGTVRADDPLLDIRGLGLEDAAPIRLVLTSDLSIAICSRLGQSAGRLPLWLLHGPGAPDAARAAWEAAGAELVALPLDGTGRPDLAAALAALGGRGITRLLCEGGGTLAAALVEAGLVDEIITYSAGLVLGAGGRPALGPLALPSLAAAPRFTLAEVAAVGADIRSRWLPLAE